MQPSETKAFKIFFWLIIASFLTFLIYLAAFYSPFVTAKTLFFYLVVEVTLPVYLYLCLKYYGFGHLKNPVMYAAAAFLGLSVISGLVGVNFLHSFWSDFDRMQGIYFSLHLIAWLAYLMLLCRIDRRKISLLFDLLIGLAVVCSLIGLLEAAGAVTLSTDFPQRSVSLFGNPIFFAAFLVIPWFSCFYMMARQPGRKYWYWAAAVLILSGVLTTKSAGVDMGLLIGVLVSAGVYTLTGRPLKTVLFGLGMFAVIIVAGSLLILKVPLLKARFTDSDAQSRLAEWGVAIRGFKEKPILGVGPENYTYLADKYIDPAVYQYSDGFFDKPHNYFLEVLDTTGIIGFLAYLSFLGFAVMGLIRFYRSGGISKFSLAVLLGGFLAYLVQNFFAFDMIAGVMTLAFLVAIATLGWQRENEPVSLNPSFALWGAGAAVLLLIFLCRINFNLAAASRNLGAAIDASATDPQTAQSYFAKLSNFPRYVDASEIGEQYETFAGTLASSYNSNPGISLGLINQSINGAIADNEQVVAKNPNYYYENYASLGRLYVLKSEAAEQIDPEIYRITAKLQQLAPNRIERDFILIDADNLENNSTGIRAAVADMLAKAPNSPDALWEQVYADALLGQDRTVLDRVQALLTPYIDDQAISKIDKLGTFYIGRTNYAQAEALYNEALMIHPNYAYFYVQLARTYAASGDKTTAAQVIETLKQKNLATYQQYQSEIEAFLQPPKLLVR